jgi:hypothetical protein
VPRGLILPERCGNDGQKLGNFKGNHTERMPKQKPESLNVIRGANRPATTFIIGDRNLFFIR